MPEKRKLVKSKYEKVTLQALAKLFPYFQIETQKRVKELGDCGKELARTTLDFYIPELRVAIEVDGEHHRYVVEYGDGAGQARFERKYKLDRLKDAFLSSIGIKLIRISNTQIDELNSDVDKLSQLLWLLISEN